MEYARHVEVPPASFSVTSRRFVVLGGGIVVALLVPIFVSLGQWQWQKAAVKEERQTMLDARASQPAVQLTASPADADAMRYRRVVVRGVFEPQHQILIENRFHQERLGYHVVTPLRIESPDDGADGQIQGMRILVNRGWIPAGRDRHDLPDIHTPGGSVELVATATPPGTRFLYLGKEAAAEARPLVWQNLDLARYRQSVDFPLQPLILLLAPESPAGFVRDWPRPDERIERHVGYAWQWFGFAVATVGIWVFFLLRPWFSKQRTISPGMTEINGRTTHAPKADS